MHDVLRLLVNALEPFRYSTGAISMGLAATNPDVANPLGPNTDGDDIAAPTGFSVSLCGYGIGEPVSGLWWNATLSDTDAFAGGAFVPRDFMFVCTGLTAEVHQPFQRGGTGTSPSDPKFYSSWLTTIPVNGSDYSGTIQSTLLNYTGIQIQFGDQGQTYRAGVAGMFPQIGGPRGPGSSPNGVTGYPGSYMPFMSSIAFGSRDDLNNVIVMCTIGQSPDTSLTITPVTPLKGGGGGKGNGFQVQNNNFNMTISGNSSKGLTAGSINAANDGTVYAPIRFTFIGYPVCTPPPNYCGVPELTPDEVNTLQKAIGVISSAASARMS